MKIIILAIGERNDVLPLIALGVEAKKMGHKVIISTSNSFKELIKGYNLSFRPCSFSLDEINYDANLKSVMENKVKNPIKYRKILKNEIKPMVNACLKEFYHASKSSDLIICNSKAVGAYDIAEYLKIPIIQISPTEFVYPIEDFANPNFSNKNYGKLLNKLTYDFKDYEPFINEINNFRVEHLKIDKRSKKAYFKKIINLELPLIYPVSKYLFKDVKGWENKIYVPGFYFLDYQDSIDTDVVRFMSKRIRPIIIVMDSLDSKVLNDLKTQLITSLKATNNTAIVISKLKGFEFNSDLIYHIEGEYDSNLFPLAKGIIHQGSIGILADSLKSGRPIAIIPETKEQLFYSKRCEKLNLVTAVVSENEITVANLTDILNKMAEAKYILKAENIEEKIEKENAAAKTIKYIEHIVKEDFYQI